MLLSVILVGLVTSARALDNGLVLTPPMGWLTWERFRCLIDCKKFPNDCISESLITRTADLMVSEGYLAAGYDYLGIDDCWLQKVRGDNGKLVPDKDRFPNGMGYIGDYIHNKGLKFGLYEDYGNKTCAGYPGVLGHEKLDIDTFVGWGVDYIKLDGCYIDENKMDEGYPEFGKLLNETGHKIVYSCSWPAYQEPLHMNVDYAAIAKYCNLWRNWDDIEDSWSSLIGIINWFGDNQDRFAQYAGPGHWNDPDMLLIGNFGLSLDQAKVQMAIWAVMAAPLLMSTDLATIRPEFKEILLNTDIIAVNQDPMGKQGLRVWQKKDSKRIYQDVWKRELQDGSFAMAFLNHRDTGTPNILTLSYEDMKLPVQSYQILDLYHTEEPRMLNPGEMFEVKVNPTGIQFYKFVPTESDGEGNDDFKRKENSVHTDPRNRLRK